MSLKDKFGKSPESPSPKEGVTGATESTNDIERFDTTANVRNLCLVDVSGKQVFLNYSYLMSGEFLPDENSITLFFTTHTVTLKGNNLEDLFEGLTTHAVKKIVRIEQRYKEIKTDTDIYIDEMQIIKIS